MISIHSSTLYDAELHIVQPVSPSIPMQLGQIRIDVNLVAADNLPEVIRPTLIDQNELRISAPQRESVEHGEVLPKLIFSVLISQIAVWLDNGPGNVICLRRAGNIER